MRFSSRSFAALLLLLPLASPSFAQKDDKAAALEQTRPKYGTESPRERTTLAEADASQSHEDHRDTDRFHRPAKVEHAEEDASKIRESHRDSEKFHRPAKVEHAEEDDDPYKTVFPPKKDASRKAGSDSGDTTRPTIKKKPSIGASDEQTEEKNFEAKPAHAPIEKTSHDATDGESTRPEDALMDDLTSEDEGLFDWDDEEEGVHDVVPWDSFFGSFSSIAATEIGDKTFIVAALMAMRHPRFQVFTAAFSALFVMTILSGITGHAVGAILSKAWSALLASLLFLGFGAKSLQEGYAMSPDQGVSEEIREVEAELEEKEVDMARQANGGARTSTISPYNLEAGRGANTRRSRSRSRMSPLQRSPSSSPSPTRSKRSVSGAVGGVRNLLVLLLSPAWVETFSMTFIGELGDRSQIATVAMAAGQEYYWVMIGATLGHFVCTAGAVLGGSVLAGRVSMRKVTLIGGSIFIAFGFFTLLEAVQYWL